MQDTHPSLALPRHPKSAPLAILLAVACHSFLAAAPGTVAVGFDTAHWVVDDPHLKIEMFDGRQTLFLSNGTAFLRDVSFQDGSIEVDLAPSQGMVFAGVVFRVKSSSECESIYLRPFASDTPNATQYTPRFNGLDAWQFYSGPDYTSTATIDSRRWTHMRITFEGRSARVYLDGGTEPVLVVHDLKRPPEAGSVGTLRRPLFWIPI